MTFSPASLSLETVDGDGHVVEVTLLKFSPIRRQLDRFFEAIKISGGS
jgi:hypothetical protein